MKVRIRQCVRSGWAVEVRKLIFWWKPVIYVDNKDDALIAANRIKHP
jgi:hypothetical protein